MDEIKIILADNQDFTKVGMRTVLQAYYTKMIEISEVKTKDELFALARTRQHHALILDFDTFDFTDLTELSELKKTSPALGILFVTDNQSSETITKLVDLGFTGYILKTASEQELIDALIATLASKKYFGSEVLDILFERKSSARINIEAGKLTQAEVEIVRLIAQGLTTKEIASQRHLSFHTIITHRKNIFRKLAISNSSELLMYAMRSGIIDSSEYYI